MAAGPLGPAGLGPVARDGLAATGRVDGKLSALEDAPVLTGEQIDQIVRAMLTPEQEATFDEHQDVDFSLQLARPGPSPWQRVHPEG